MKGVKISPHQMTAQVFPIVWGVKCQFCSAKAEVRHVLSDLLLCKPCAKRLIQSLKQSDDTGKSNSEVSTHADKGLHHQNHQHS